MTLEGIDNVERSDGLTLSVLSVGDGVANDTFEEGLEDSTGLFVDHYLMNALIIVSLSDSYEKEKHTSRDTLDTTTTCETTNGRLGDTLNVVTKNLPVALGTSLSKSLSTFSASSHDEVW